LQFCSTLQVFCIIIAAFRVELFSAALTANTGDRDLPYRICLFIDADDDGDNRFYGDRVCNNAIAGAVMSILFAMGFMIVDLQMPCTTSTVTYYFT